MNLSEILAQYPDIRVIGNPNAENYKQVVSQALRHSSRSDMDDLYNIARPNEEEVFKKWRQDNRRHITVAPIFTFKLMLIRVLQASLQDIETEIYPGLKDFVYDELTDLSIVDPNSVIIEWPYNPELPDIAPAAPADITGFGNNMRVSTMTKIIESNILHHKNIDICIWETGSINIGTENSPVMAATFAAVDNNNYYTLLPIKEKDKVRYTADIWYYHGLDRVPIAELPGFRLKSGYKESICFPAFPLLDEAVIALSSDQVTRIRHSQPKLVVNADLTCPKCNSAGTELVRGEKVVCRTCGGNGVLQNIGDFATVRIKGKSEFDRQNANPIYYVNAPDGIEYPMQVWEKLIAKAEKALCTDLLEGTGTESGVAKELRMEPKQDILKMYGEQFCRMVESIINNRAQLLDLNAVPVVVSPPAYYQTKSPELIRVELDGSLPGERYMKYMELVKTKYRGNDLMIRVHSMAVLYAPLLLYKTDEIDTVINLGSYDERDIKRRDYAVYVMGELLMDAANENVSKRDLFDLADKLLIDMGVMADPNVEMPMPLDEIKSAGQLPDDLDELEEVLTKLLNNEISREDALRLVVIIEGISEQEAEALLTDTGL